MDDCVDADHRSNCMGNPHVVVYNVSVIKKLFVLTENIMDPIIMVGVPVALIVIGALWFRSKRKKETVHTHAVVNTPVAGSGGSSDEGKLIPDSQS
jgi:hypothetical protein